MLRIYFRLPRRGELCSPAFVHGMRSFSGGASPSPTGWSFVRDMRSFSAGRPGGRPLQEIFIFPVGAIHESPAFIIDNRLFSKR